MSRPLNVLIRDVTCRTISTDDGNLNCCFVSQQHGAQGNARVKQRGKRSPWGCVHTCINMRRDVREPRATFRRAHASVAGQSESSQFRTRCTPTLPESARFFLGHAPDFVPAFTRRGNDNVCRGDTHSRDNRSYNNIVHALRLKFPFIVYTHRAAKLLSNRFTPRS